jgi:hypothetical protein
MKIIYLIIIFTSLCFSQSEFLDIKFYDSSQQEFHSLSLKTEIDILYKFDSKPYILLYITRSQNNPLYKQQLKHLNDIDAEQLQLLFVESNAENINEDMYHTDKNTALNLLEKEKDFKVMLLDGKGKILFVSTKAITEKEIKQVLRK